MKLKLGVRTIDVNKIAKIDKKGYNIAVVTLKNGKEVKIMCKYTAENSFICSYPGTYEEFKSVIERLADN